MGLDVSVLILSWSLKKKIAKLEASLARVQKGVSGDRLLNMQTEALHSSAMDCELRCFSVRVHGLYKYVKTISMPFLMCILLSIIRFSLMNQLLCT